MRRKPKEDVAKGSVLLHHVFYGMLYALFSRITRDKKNHIQKNTKKKPQTIFVASNMYNLRDVTRDTKETIISLTSFRNWLHLIVSFKVIIIDLDN